MSVEANQEIVSHVLFGLDPLWVSTILFVVTYVVIITERINRAIVAGLGASLMIAHMDAKRKALGI